MHPFNGNVLRTGFTNVFFFSRISSIDRWCTSETSAPGNLLLIASAKEVMFSPVSIGWLICQ